jgi:hypothetical protein
MSNSRRGFELDIGFTDHLRILTTTSTELDTRNITVTAAHVKVSLSSLHALGNGLKSGDSSASVLTARTNSSRQRPPHNSPSASTD